MINTCIYLTRKCPYNCSYCRLRVSNLSGPELTSSQWKVALSVLSRNFKPDFNLFLGNETWLFDDLPDIVHSVQSPYAVYTSCFPHVFNSVSIRKMFEGEKRLDNLSCGCDYPFDVARKHIDVPEYRKAYNAHMAFATVRTMYPTVDCQGTITISADNLRHVVDTIKELSFMGVDVGLNFIHSDTGGFDFFPPGKEIDGLLINPHNEEHRKHLVRLNNYLLKRDNRVQNAEDTMALLTALFAAYADVGSRNTCWHCNGDPYGGPSIDADGSLRCCGYRKGTRTSQMSIFDLDNSAGIDRWREAVEADSKECPGCTWSYPRLYRRYRHHPTIGKQVFVNHAQVKDCKVTRMNERIVQ